MRGYFYRWSLVAGLLAVGLYATHASSTIPKIALESVSLLKKPIEDLLPDLQEAPPPSEEAENAPLDLDAYQEIKNSRERWNEMRQLIEAGEPIYTPLPSEVAISTVPTGRLAPAVPPPPGFTVQLPYESRLTVSGRKTIGFDYKSASYSNSTYATEQGIPTTQNSFLLNQQLQVRINGQVGRKVTVNVNYDDTKTDTKDISIVYKGDPDEIVQRAAFGDITLSLPQTEFVGYNKQLFGASAELRYKALHEYLIGSQTKGQSETKVFTGNVTLQRPNPIPDTGYIRRQYYNVNALTAQVPGAGSTVGIVQGSESIWLDDRSQRVNISTTIAQVDGSLVLPGSGYTFSTTQGQGFFQLAAGRDYTINAKTGLITFSPSLNLSPNAVVAVDYTIPNLNARISQFGVHPGLLKILKFDETDPTLPSSASNRIPATEDLTHYNLGATNIIPDNGQGNFTLTVVDLNNNNVGSSVGLVYLPNNAGQIQVDFNLGIISLTKPFPSAAIYNSIPTHQYSFFIEYQSQIKTYTLRPNIVLNSERILMNGRLLTRDVDYFIDYQSGFLTFFNPSQITQDTQIQATYDFSPTGIAGAAQDTLVGERTELSMYPITSLLANSYVGSTVLYDFAPKPTSAPNIQQTAGSYLLTEGDVHFKDLVFDSLPFLKSNFTAEAARSAVNPNTYGQAIIENFEGIQNETDSSMNLISWTIAQNPNSSAGFANAIYQGLGNELVSTLSINPNASALASDQTQVLDINYNLAQTSTSGTHEASIVTELSPAGLDFSQKQYLVLYVQGDGSNAAGSPSGVQLNITMGQINEDADATGGGGFTDIYGFHPKGSQYPRTEDLNHNRILDVGEDTGWTYFNPDGTSVQIGQGNLRLDTEDLEGTNLLSPGNPTLGGDVGYNSLASSFTATGASGPNALDFSGWQLITIPLNISSATASNWTAIKEMRVSLKSPGAAKGTIKIARIGVVGNNWLAQPPQVSGATITVRAVNNVDNGGPPTNYSSPNFGDFNSLNQINTALSGPQPTKRKEQALAVDYSFDNTVVSGSSITAKEVFLTAADYTYYGSLRFFVFGDNNGETMVFRAGSDTDFFEFSTPVNWSGWKELYIDQIGDNQRPTTWQVNAMDPLGSTTRVQGRPQLSYISELQVGIINTSCPTGAVCPASSGEIWVDDLFATNVITRVGYAARLQSDFEIYGWGTFGAGVKDIDRNFQTYDSAISNQDRHELKSYLNVTRLSFFPMKFTASKIHTDTPNINQITNTSLISVQQQGNVDQQTFSGTGKLQLPRWPVVGLLYDTNDTNTGDLFKNDHVMHYGGTLDYTLPGQHLFFPKTVSLGYKRTDEKIGYGPDALTNALLNGTDPFSVSNTQDKTNDFSARMSFQPKSGFSFSPNYSLSLVHEYLNAIDTGTFTSTPINYDKERAQTMGFDSTFGIKRWFAPRVRYSITDRETFGIPLAAAPTANSFKNVDRTDTGEFAWDTAWRDLTPRVRALQSLNLSSSYLIEDGDDWTNVASGYNTLPFFSIRQGLNPGNSEAQLSQRTERDTLRSTMRWSPFDWATHFTGSMLPLRTMTLTNTFTNTNQTTDTTGTTSRILTRIIPDMILSMTQTEYFFHLEKYMSNSQMNIKSQEKTVDTVGTSHEKAATNGADWRFTLIRKLDLFLTYTRATDNTFDLINNVTSANSQTDTFGAQLGFNVGKWRVTPKYDQTIQKASDSTGQLVTDLTTRTPALQLYADLFLPAGLKLPFSDILVFSNRIRTTSTLSLTQKRSSLNAIQNNTDTYALTTSEDYEITSNIRLTVGGTYSYQVNKISSDANFYSYELNSLMTIQF